MNGKTNREKRKSIKNKSILLISIIISVFIIAILILLIPYLLKCQIVSEKIKWFLDGLLTTDYKVAYIGLIGGIVGSMLGVVGAVYVQERTDRLEQFSYIRRCARITYYDMKLFYKDFSFFVVPFLTEQSNENYNKLIMSTKVLANPEWIKTVAELRVFLNENEIDTVYNFYGKLFMLEGIMQADKSVKVELKERVRDILLQLGFVNNGNYEPCANMEDGCELNTTVDNRISIVNIMNILAINMAE